MNHYTSLIEGCRNKDPRAQLQFYSLFSQGVYNSSLRIVGNPQEAEEIMQETFLKVLTRGNLYQPDEGAMARMLKRIAINHSIDIYRRRNARFEEFSERHSAGLSDEEPYTEEETEVSLALIREGLELLPEGYRVVLSLRLIEGIGYGQIAARLGISAAGVRSQYIRGRRRLQQIIREKQKQTAS